MNTLSNSQKIYNHLDRILTKIDATLQYSPEQYLTLKQTLIYTSLSRPTINRAVKNKSLKCSKRAGRLLFKVKGIDKWLDGKK